MIRARLFHFFGLIPLFISCSQTNPAAWNAEGSSHLVFDKDSGGAPKSDTSSSITKGKNIPIDTAFGDLDKDGVSEMAIVVTTPSSTDYLGFERRLDIYKRERRRWKKWHESNGPVLPSDAGGMMGDPFQGVEIKNGKIYIYHFGGSRQKWSYTHQYRYHDDNWYLIGATMHFGANCDDFKQVDYNLLTGNGEVIITTDSCDDNGVPIRTAEHKVRFSQKPVEPVKMDAFSPGENRVILRSDQAEFYY